MSNSSFCELVSAIRTNTDPRALHSEVLTGRNRNSMYCFEMQYFNGKLTRVNNSTSVTKK